MNNLEKISIKNFRGFNNLEIDGFKKINVFLGKNNSGKSTILESLFLLIGMSNPILPDNINRMRGLNIKNAEEFKYLYHKLKFSNVPEFHANFKDTTERSLLLNPIHKKGTASESTGKAISTDEISTIDASTASPKVSGLELEFSLKKRHSQKKTLKSSIVFNQLNQSEFIPIQNSKYKEELHAVLITGDSKESNALSRYSEIVKRKKEDIILEAIQNIDPNIEDIHPLPDGLYFSYKGIEELIPTNISGDGVRRYFSIVTTIAEKPDSIILIDEIENGLHYSAHKLLWESIINIANSFSVQLFITSHNIETLKFLKEVLESDKYESFQDDVGVYTVSHTKKAGIKTYRYSFEGFKDAIESNIEIRQ